MAHAAGLDQIEGAVALPARFHVCQLDPGVHERGQTKIAGLHHGVFVAQAREHRRDAARLEEVHHPQQRRVHLTGGAPERGDRVDYHNVRPEPLDVAVHPCQVHFQPVKAGAGCLELEQASPRPVFQVEPDRAGVAADLGAALLEHEREAALTPRAGRLDHMGADRGLAGAR